MKVITNPYGFFQDLKRTDSMVAPLVIVTAAGLLNAASGVVISYEVLSHTTGGFTSFIDARGRYYWRDSRLIPSVVSFFRGVPHVHGHLSRTVSGF